MLGSLASEFIKDHWKQKEREQISSTTTDDENDEDNQI